MGESRWENRLVLEFPKLANERFKIVGAPTDWYNCIAFAAGDTSRWWSHKAGTYWPESATRSSTIASLREAFSAIDFEPCDGGGVEPGFEKVVLYEQQGAWTHAAVQTSRGAWLSKVGKGPVIEHQNPESLSGQLYGKPTIYMRRTKATHRSANI